MIGRRALLSLIAAAPLADAFKGSVRRDQVAGLLGDVEIPEAPSDFENFAVQPAEFMDPDDYDPYALMGALRFDAGYPPGRPSQMPMHIATKKSWSPAFKMSVWRHQIDEANRLREAIRRNKQFRKKLGKMLGLSSGRRTGGWDEPEADF